MNDAKHVSRRRAMAYLVAGLVAVACSRSDAPVEPVWGKEPCAHCKMLVGDKRYAAQILDEEGDRRFFDDVGCMILWLEARRSPRRAWVHMGAAGGWVDANAAHYAAGARTPMDFGFEATPADGVTFAAARAAVLARKKDRP